MKSILRRYLIVVALIWAGCLALFAFAYISILVPQSKARKQVEQQLLSKKRIYDSAMKAARQESRLKLTQQVQQLQNQLKDFVIEFEDAANLTLDISQLAKAKKIASFSIQSKDEDKRSRQGPETPGFKQIQENYADVTFVATGFNQFATFLNALERHRPVVFVDSFIIARSRKQSSGQEVSMNLSFIASKRQDTEAQARRAPSARTRLAGFSQTTQARSG